MQMCRLIQVFDERISCLVGNAMRLVNLLNYTSPTWQSCIVSQKRRCSMLEQEKHRILEGIAGVDTAKQRNK